MESNAHVFLIECSIGPFKYWLGKDRKWQGLRNHGAKFSTEEKAESFAQEFADRECEIIKEYYE